MKNGFGVILISATATLAACGGAQSPTAPANDNASRSAVIDSAGRSAASENELTGVVEAIPPATAASTFRVAGKTVVTTSSTVFADGSFASLAIGTRVEVHGTLAGNTLTATRVEILAAAPAPPVPPVPPVPPTTPPPGAGHDNDDDHGQPGEDHDNAEAEATGTLGAISGTCPAITGSVGSTRFSTSASTRFEDTSCSGLKSGDRVEVKGTRMADGTIAASRLEKKK